MVSCFTCDFNVVFIENIFTFPTAPGQQPPFPEGATPPAQGPGGPRLPPYPGGPPGPQPHMFPQAPGSTQSPGPGMDQTRVPFQAGMPPFQPGM